jgi:DNA ligase-1
LIALAHALALTQTHTTKENKNESSSAETIPPEALLYRNANNSAQKLEAAVSIIKKAYSEVPSYDSVLDAALKVPLDQLHTLCSLTPGIPVEPMLAKPTKSIHEVLKRLNGQGFTCEFKYDGERAQVHLMEDGSYKVFSRNLLETTVKYPEVPVYVQEAAVETVTSFVLDTEVVAFHRETNTLVPFQILSTRKKTEASAETAKVQVIVQAFDIMYLNGQSLLSKSLQERRALLRQNFTPVEGKFQFAKALDHEENGDTTVLEEFLDTAVKGQCEGLMIKTFEASYEPSKRSLHWLKLKKDYLEGLGDSVDLVPLGGYYGRGKRTGVFGAYLLACYDPELEEYQSVCKIGTGFSDEDLQELSKSLQEHAISRKASNYNTADSLECDVWFDATQVWEVKAADLSVSSVHKGALGRVSGAERGIGLRFPRFERIRDDKKPQQATTSDQILELYYNQDSIVDNVGDEDEDGI